MRIHTVLALVPPLFLLILFGFFLTFFSGCYTLKQGSIMLGYLGHAIPLEKLRSRPDEDASTLAFIERVTDIRRFAMEELGLKESKNYTRYVELDRDYLAAVVSACAADSFTRHEWRFPVVGTVPYKGFFNPEDAKKEGARLKAEGLDVWIRGVDAFSTLGWFRDPLYSYMKKYETHRLADLIIHELLHATVFVKGQVQFNEQLAEFVGSRGARLYMESRFGPGSPECLAIDNAAADADAFRTFLKELAASLETVYNRTDLDLKTKLSEKEKIIKAAQERFEAEYDERFRSDAYRSFVSLPINNAYLDLYRLYYEEDIFLADLYETMNYEPLPNSGTNSAGENEDAVSRNIRRFRAFVAAASALNNSGKARHDPRSALKTALGQSQNAHVDIYR